VNPRYLLINLPAAEIRSETFAKIKSLAGTQPAGAPRLGVGAIISYLRWDPAKSRETLMNLLSLCEHHDLSVIVQLDGEQWWNNRPDLWNWWDPSRPGFNPANVANVERSSWSTDDALKIAWRNWGRQCRVLPPPNLMSQRYREACHIEMKLLLAEIVNWRDRLPPEKKDLLVGVKVGWESAIGMGYHYYPDGNKLLNQDPSNDPEWKTQPHILPGRGFQAIGYAAVSTAGLASEGLLEEKHLAEVIRRHLDDLAAVARASGWPREQIFTHCGGWAEGEMLYKSALNSHSCPGWSFYKFARNPRQDRTAMAAVAASDAPFFAAVEWKPVGARTADDWRDAITNTLTIPKCRYVCIYNWRKLLVHGIAQEGLQLALAAPLPPAKP